jgi:hypothetical protein
MLQPFAGLIRGTSEECAFCFVKWSMPANDDLKGFAIIRSVGRRKPSIFREKKKPTSGKALVAAIELSASFLSRGKQNAQTPDEPILLTAAPSMPQDRGTAP